MRPDKSRSKSVAAPTWPQTFVRGSLSAVLVAGLVSAGLDLLVGPTDALAKDNPPMGIIAVSAGDVVVLVEPASGAQKSLSSGPVGWLFPAPGGTLFAPDLVHGKTTVINLLSLATETRIDGVTMPYFGIRADRYVVLARDILIVSYPERALVTRIDIGFERPWQVEVLAEDTVLVVLERSPEGGENAVLSIVKLDEGKLVYRRPLSSDIRHFSFSPALGVMALADPEGGRVLLSHPETLATAAEFKVSGRPVDLAFVEHGSTLAVAIERQDGGGELAIWKIKPDKKDALQRKKEWTVPLSGAPVRLVRSPDDRHVVVGLETKELQIVRIEKRQATRLFELPDVPRDVVWCDPLREGPLLPDWSDDDPPTLDLSGG